MKADRILRWFPRSWRERYEVEVRTLLESGAVGWRSHIDLLAACGDAWYRVGVASGRRGARTGWGLLVVAICVAGIWALGWTVGLGVEALVATEAGASTSAWVSALLWFKLPIVFLVFITGWPREWWASGTWERRVALGGLLVTLLLMIALEPGSPGFPEALAVGMLVTLPWFPALRAVIAAVTRQGQASTESPTP